MICNRSHVCIICFTARFFATYKVCVLSDYLNETDCLMKEEGLHVKIHCNVIMFSHLDKSLICGTNFEDNFSSTSCKMIYNVIFVAFKNSSK